MPYELVHIEIHVRQNQTVKSMKIYLKLSINKEEVNLSNVGLFLSLFFFSFLVVLAWSFYRKIEWIIFLQSVQQAK